ncbi:hypothetical protein BDV93DRAFT_515489 [Ceratobasidium sp. AG-I]|nr:hypothetical protein BDV93DRAFT_515489 [Ceratobasidium sp. AG-I]
MSYEYTTCTEFHNDHPDWSGCPDLIADDNSASYLTNTGHQPASHQQYPHGQLDAAPTQDTNNQGTGLTQDEWLGVPIGQFPADMPDQSTGYPQGIISEIPMSYSQEQDPQHLYVPSNEELLAMVGKYKSAQLPLEDFEDLMSRTLVQDQIPSKPMHVSFRHELREYSQACRFYDSSVAENNPLEAEAQPEDYELAIQAIQTAFTEPKDWPKQNPAQPAQTRRRKLPFVDKQATPHRPQPASQLRVSRQKGRAERSRLHRDHVYRDPAQIDDPQTGFPETSSSNQSSSTSSVTSTVSISPITSYRASPVSNTSAELNNSPSATTPEPIHSTPLPVPIPVPSQRPPRPDIKPAELLADLLPKEWADVLFQQAEAVKKDPKGPPGMSVHIAHLGCKWVNPMTLMACHTSPSNQPQEHLKSVAGRNKCGFFARTGAEFARHLEKHRKAEDILIEQFNLPPERQTQWNHKILDAQAWLDRFEPDQQLWLEGEQREF